jgi:hypothetical protein
MQLMVAVARKGTDVNYVPADIVCFILGVRMDGIGGSLRMCGLSSARQKH